ncbi:hypothetical protein QTJ16_005773 [Diplocarpon rosae]|uniref:Nitroreductase domain-containing protein n=1 Tax=Diplocarpon rosae TaxID=946125 RepID=A0AAD9SVS3_9HELO|nr:hypothetical protein QTJ16_005773 [Diplocarpon rosae]
MSGSAAYLSAIKARRTIYALKKESPIPDSKIQEIVKDVVLATPSSFNNQTNRYVLLVKEEHDKLWEIVKGVIKAIVPAEAWESSEQRLNGFKAGYGTVSVLCFLFPLARSLSLSLSLSYTHTRTYFSPLHLYSRRLTSSLLTPTQHVLFFASRKAITSTQEAYAIYAERFPSWAEQSLAIAQATVWTAFAAEGLGASLQHYNPLINEKVAETWGIDKDWELNAQLVFGAPAAGPGEKTALPVEETFKSFGV